MSRIAVTSLIILFSVETLAAPAPTQKQNISNIKSILKELEEKRKRTEFKRADSFSPVSQPPPSKSIAKRSEKPSVLKATPSFDLPITYNSKVKKWIVYYQTNGRKWFRKRLERSHRYLPLMTYLLKQRGLPQDLAYISMIESGFSPRAVSSADAVGYWQFIKGTANRYGLQTSWWIDERRDFSKSTLAAADYLEDLYKMFGSWYLSAAGYNMGENRVKRLIKQHGTRNFWILSRKRNFPRETSEYIPKLIAAMIIAKSPGLYGFYGLKPQAPLSYDYFYAPGGTDLHAIAKHTGLDKRNLLKLNSELLKGFIPKSVANHKIRIPRGSLTKISTYFKSSRN